VTGSLAKASWRVVAQPPLLVTVGTAVLLSLATAPYLNRGNTLPVRVGMAILLACALAATAEDPAPEVTAATPHPRWIRCGTRLLLGVALVLPVAIASLALVEVRVPATPTRAGAVQMLALMTTGPAIGFGVWAWGRVSQPTYAALVGVLCLALGLWLMPGTWSVIEFQPWGRELDAFLTRCAALALLGGAVVACSWRDPALRG